MEAAGPARTAKSAAKLGRGQEPDNLTGQKATMLGWRKKREGFEWHDYVRTTILVRRANRRQKVDDARKAAAEGLKG